MDRGDGGGPPRKGSSLPRTLHGSLLQPGSQAMSSSMFAEEQPQASPEPTEERQGAHEYAAYPAPTHTHRSTPVPSSSRGPPAFEEGSSQGAGSSLPLRRGTPSTRPGYDDGRAVGQQQQQPPPYAYHRSSYRTNVGSTEPALYASSSSSSSAAASATIGAQPSSAHLYSYPPPVTPTPATTTTAISTRLPPVRALEQEAEIASSRYQGYRAEEYRAPWVPQIHEREQQQQAPSQSHAAFWEDDPWEEVHRQDQYRLNAAFQSLETSSRDEPAWATAGPSTRRREQQQQQQPEQLQDHRRSAAAHQTISAARSTISGLQDPPASSTASAAYHTQLSYPSTSGGGRGAGVPRDTSFIPHLQPYFEQTGYASAPQSPGRSGAVDPPTLQFGIYPLPPEGIEHVGPPYDVRRAQPPLLQREPSDEDKEGRATPAARQAEVIRLGKRKAPDDDEDDDDFTIRPRRITRKTLIACNFCRGRKLKCDGHTPMCSNCSKRNLPCRYAAYPKRRGPGKAPKGQRKQQTQPSAGPSSGYTSGTSEQDVRHQARPADERMAIPSAQAALPSSYGAVPSTQLAAPSPRGAIPSSSGLGVYPAYPAHPSLFGLIDVPLDLQLPPIHHPSVSVDGFPRQLQYPAPGAAPAAAPPAGGGEAAGYVPPGDPRMRGLWRSTSQASVTTTTTATGVSRDEGSHDESSSPELRDTLQHDEQRRDGGGEGGGGGGRGGGAHVAPGHHLSGPPPPPSHIPSRRGSYR